MKRFLTLLLVASALVACEKETPWVDPDLARFRQTKANMGILDVVPDPGTITEPINFFEKISFWDEWRYIGPIEERFAALERPEYEALVKDMTTLALVKTAVNYPQNALLYSAWNDKFAVIDCCVKYHVAFRELISRENAEDILIGAFVKAKVDPAYLTFDINNPGIRDPEVIEELDMLSPGNEKALSYLIASKYFDFSKSQYLSSLISATASKLAEWKSRGYWTNQDPLELIMEKYTDYTPSKAGE